MQHYPNRPWTVITQHLRDRYRIVGEIDFLEVGYDPIKVYHLLKQLHKTSYDCDERIVVYHYDLEYYTEMPYGIMIYNFLQAVRSLDISPSVFVIFTSHYGIGQEIKQYWHKHRPWHDYITDGMTVFESSYQQMQSPQTVLNTELDIDHISHAYMCLSGQRRVHRQLFLSELQNLGLLHRGICSWHFKQQHKFMMFSDSVIQALKLRNWISKFGKRNDAVKHGFLQVIPHVKVNEDWVVDQDFCHVHQQHRQLFDQDYKHSLIAGTTNDYRFNLPAIKNALLYVSMESAYHHPYPYLTEKTFKAIVMKRPFAIVGSPGSLAKLRELGFRTFDQYWDESYDYETNPNQRLRQVLSIVNSICQLDIADLQKLCYNMSDVLEHNFVHYRECYAKTQLLSRLTEL